jgi:hypothetical protein
MRVPFGWSFEARGAHTVPRGSRPAVAHDAGGKGEDQTGAKSQQFWSPWRGPLCDNNETMTIMLTPDECKSIAALFKEWSLKILSDAFQEPHFGGWCFIRTGPFTFKPMKVHTSARH